MSEQEEPNEPDLASMRLPSPEELARERAAAKAVAENPSFVAAVRKLARNTLRTSPRGLEPVYSRKTHPGLGDAQVTSGSAAVTPDVAVADVAVATKAASADAATPSGAVASEKITPADRRVLIIGFGLILIVINVIGIGIWVGLTYVGRTPEAVTTPTQTATTQGHSSASAPSADPTTPSATGSTAEPTQTASTAPTNTPSTTRTSEPTMTATGTGTSDSSSKPALSARPTATGTTGIWMMDKGAKP